MPENVPDYNFIAVCDWLFENMRKTINFCKIKTYFNLLYKLLFFQ